MTLRKPLPGKGGPLTSETHSWLALIGRARTLMENQLTTWEGALPTDPEGIALVQGVLKDMVGVGLRIVDQGQKYSDGGASAGGASKTQIMEDLLK